MTLVRRIALGGLGAAARAIHLPAYSGLPLQVVGGFDPAARAGDFPFPLSPPRRRCWTRPVPTS